MKVTTKNNLDKLNQIYNKYMLVGDFNVENSETCTLIFLFEINSRNIVNNYTCHKSVENPSCIDIVIKNSPLSFQNTVAAKIGFFDFHKMVITVLKIETNSRENWR